MASGMSRKNKDKRNKSEGGKRKAKTHKGHKGHKAHKGKTHKARKTHKLSKGATKWHEEVMKRYKKMKAENPETKLSDAMKRASEDKKKGMF